MENKGLRICPADDLLPSAKGTCESQSALPTPHMAVGSTGVSQVTWDGGTLFPSAMGSEGLERSQVLRAVQTTLLWWGTEVLQVVPYQSQKDQVTCSRQLGAKESSGR